MASLHSSWRYGKRNKLRVKVSQDPEDYYRLDPKRSAVENAYDIYKMLCSRDTRDTKRLFLLNALASLCLATNGIGQNNNFRFNTEELFYCLSASLVHTFTQVRAAALRTIRYVLVTPKDIKVFNSMQLQYLLCRSIDLMLKNDDERVQALKLVRKMLAISPEDISPVVVRCLVSLADSGIEESDNLLRACLATLSECAVLNPTLLIVCGGVTSITRNVLECHNPRIAESLCGVLLYLLEWPQTRNICGVRLDCLAAPYCDFTYRLGIMDKNKDARELRYTSCRLALLSILRSWTGTLEFCDPSKPSGLKAIVDALYLNQVEVRKAILDLLYELLGLPQPAWTESYAYALQTVDPSDFQDNWLLSNGFVAAEGRSILPSLAARAPNIVEQHLSLQLYCFLETGLLNALVEVIVSSDAQVSVRATVLIGKLIHLMHTHLPADICSTSPALPTLISHATQGNQQATAAISALQTYQKMLRQRPAAYSLFLDSIIQGGGLVQTRLFRRDLNAQEYAASNAAKNLPQQLQQNPVLGGTSPVLLTYGSLGIGGLSNTGFVGGSTMDRPRLDSVSSSDESNSQPSSSIRSSLRFKRRFLPFFDNMRALNRLIKDSNVLTLPEGIAWDWEVVTTILRSNLIRKMDDTTSKFLKRLVEYFKPSSNRFSHQDLAHGGATPCYVTAGLDLIDVLLNSNELESMRLITDYFSDISQHLLLVTTSNRAHDCLFSPQHMNTTMCQQYFLYIGRMCRVQKGISILTNTAVFAHLITLVRNTDHVCYVKLIVTGLDYSMEMMPRKVLEKALTSARTRTGRLYATQFLGVLLRAHLPNFVVWGIPLILQQTKDADRSVVLGAMDVLEEACHEKYYLEEIVSLWPNLKSLGDVGRLLMSRYYALSRGLNHSKARIKDEIEYWKNGYNKRYVLLVEADTHASLTLHVRNEDGYYSRRNCNTRPIIVPPNIAPHLYGQLVQTTQGTTALRKYGDLPQLIEIVTRAKCSDETECIELKSAIWAVAHASTHSNGIEYFVETGARIYEKLIMLVTKCEVYSIRATCFSTLGVIAGTNAGANLLFKLNWLSVRHDRNTTWPVHQPEDWLSSNHTPVRHHYEDMPPYNYTGIEDQIDGSYYTGSYWNLLLGSGSCTTTKGGGVAVDAVPGAQTANTTATTITTGSTVAMSSVNDEVLPLIKTNLVVNANSNANAITTTNVTATAAKSKTLPEGTSMRPGKHQRSLSDPKTMDVLLLMGGGGGGGGGMPAGGVQQQAQLQQQMQQHRIRYNSCTDSNTSGVSSCESVTGRTAATAGIGDYQQFALSPIPSMSNLLDLPLTQAKLLRRTSLLGTTYLQHALSPLDLKGYAQLRSLRAHSRPVFLESSAELYDFIDFMDRTEMRVRKSSFGESSQRNMKVRSLDRQASLKVFSRLSTEELRVPLPTLNAPKFLSQNDLKGPCYSGICLPKNPIDLFPTRNLLRTYVSRDIQDQDLMDINLLTAKQQFLNDSLNNEAGDESSVISSLSDVSSVSKRTKWHQLGAKHGRSQCLNCARSARRSQRGYTTTLRTDVSAAGSCEPATGGTSTMAMTALTAINGGAPDDLYVSVAARLQANLAFPRKSQNSKQPWPPPAPPAISQQQQLSTSAIQLSDISFNSPESILSEESLPDRITASILYNVQRLANPVSAKQSKMALLELKQKHPNTFQDICLYSEASKTLGRSTYRMSARRFLQELFLDLNFDSFYSEPQEILGKKAKLWLHGTPTAEATEYHNMELAVLVEQSMLGTSPSSSAASVITAATLAAATAAMHGKSQLKSKPLASVYEASCENLLVEQSPHMSYRTVVSGTAAATRATTSRIIPAVAVAAAAAAAAATTTIARDFRMASTVAPAAAAAPTAAAAVPATRVSVVTPTNVENHKTYNNELHIGSEDDEDNDDDDDDDDDEDDVHKSGDVIRADIDSDTDVDSDGDDDVDDAGEDICDGREPHMHDNVNTHSGAGSSNVAISIISSSSGGVGVGGVGGGGSSNCSDQTTNSNRSSICTISQQPTLAAPHASIMPIPISMAAATPTTTAATTIAATTVVVNSASMPPPALENENKKYTRGRFYTLELDLSCTKNKFPITDRNRTPPLTTSSMAPAAATANTSATSPTTTTPSPKPNLTPWRLSLTSPTKMENPICCSSATTTTTTTPTEANPTELNVAAQHRQQQQTLSDAAIAGAKTTPHAVDNSTTQDTPSLLLLDAPTHNTHAVTKSLAASMTKPVGSLFCEKRLQTSKSEAVLSNVIHTTTTTATTVATPTPTATATAAEAAAAVTVAGPSTGISSVNNNNNNSKSNNNNNNNTGSNSNGNSLSANKTTSMSAVPAAATATPAADATVKSS